MRVIPTTCCTLGTTVAFSSSRDGALTRATIAAFGTTARIEGKWQREDEDGWSTILSTDSRLSNNGFSLAVSPADVDARTSFEASVVVD